MAVIAGLSTGATPIIVTMTGFAAIHEPIPFLDVGSMRAVTSRSSPGRWMRVIPAMTISAGDTGITAGIISPMTGYTRL
jgi:hypothetical protein